jgi:putative Mg2+ transporter-C (MgtC) family protein
MDLWNFFTELEMVCRIFFACLLGGIIGWERERHGIYSAGIRTYSAIAIGACAFGVISNYITNDPAHVAANVITGIGFLGGGIIFRQEGNYVAGVTTAATLWAAASIGLSVAYGMYLIAICTTLLIYLLLYLPRLPWWQKVSHPRHRITSSEKK